MNITAPERAAVAAAIPAQALNVEYRYVAFKSKFLGVNVFVGLEYEGEDFNYQHCMITAGWEIRDVWIDGADLSQYLHDDVMPYLEAEAIKAMEAAS